MQHQDLVAIGYISDSVDDSKDQTFNKAMLRNVQTAYTSDNHTETSVVLMKSLENCAYSRLVYAWINRSSPDLF